MYILLITTDVIPDIKDEIKLLLRCCHSDEPDNEELLLEILDRLMSQYIDVAHRNKSIKDLKDEWLWDEIDNNLFVHLQRNIKEHPISRRASSELVSINVMNTCGDLALHFKL